MSDLDWLIFVVAATLSIGGFQVIVRARLNAGRKLERVRYREALLFGCGSDLTPLAKTQVTVLTATGEKARIFDRDGREIGNPTTTDDDGNIDVWLPLEGIARFSLQPEGQGTMWISLYPEVT